MFFSSFALLPPVIPASPFRHHLFLLCRFSCYAPRCMRLHFALTLCSFGFSLHLFSLSTSLSGPCLSCLCLLCLFLFSSLSHAMLRLLADLFLCMLFLLARFMCVLCRYCGPVLCIFIDSFQHFGVFCLFCPFSSFCWIVYSSVAFCFCLDLSLSHLTPSALAVLAVALLEKQRSLFSISF